MSAIPKYSYKYFDESDQLQTKQLNIFQYFARKIFGCYAETHLSNVVKKAYVTTLKGTYFSKKVDRKLLKLIVKAKDLYGSKSFIKILSYSVLADEKLRINVKYDIKRAEEKDYKISSIGFKFIFSKESQVKESEISIYKNEGEKIIVDVKPSDLDPKQVEVIKTLIGKILIDSTSPTMSDVFLYQNNTNDEDISPVIAWGKFGWEIEERLWTQDQYHFNRNKAKRNSSLDSHGRNLSTNFAASFLEIKART